MNPFRFLIGLVLLAGSYVFIRHGLGVAHAEFLSGMGFLVFGIGVGVVGLPVTLGAFARPVEPPYIPAPVCAPDRHCNLTGMHASEYVDEPQAQPRRDSIAEYWEQQRREGKHVPDPEREAWPQRQPDAQPAPYIAVEPRRGLPAGQEWKRLEGQDLPALPDGNTVDGEWVVIPEREYVEWWHK